MGASGNVGGKVACDLLQCGHHVRAVIPDPNSSCGKELKEKGATLVDSGKSTGDSKMGSLYFDEKTVTNAFNDADGAFVLIPPNLEAKNPDEEVDEYLKVLKRCIENAQHLKKIVFLSSIGSHASHAIGEAEKTHRLEETFKPLASEERPFVFVRPSTFYTDLHGSLQAVSSGKLPNVLDKDSKIEMISPDDVGCEIAKQLTKKDKSCGKLCIVELSGPKPVSMSEVVQICSDICGKEVKYEKISVDTLLDKHCHHISKQGAKSLSDTIVAAENGKIDFEDKSKIERGNKDIREYIQCELKNAKCA